MTCITIDDEQNALDIINDYIERVPFLELAASFQDPIKAIDYYNKHQVDLVYLDINMPDITGMQFLKTLQDEPMVIFTTAYSDFAIESFDFNVIDYLLKPIEFERFMRASNKAYKNHQLLNSNKEKPTEDNQKDFLLLKSGGTVFKVSIKDIAYVEAMGNYVTFYTKDNKIVSYYSMKQVLEMLSGTEFLRIHRSYLISLNHIDHYEIHRVKILGKKLPIGATYRREFMQKMENLQGLAN